MKDLEGIQRMMCPECGKCILDISAEIKKMYGHSSQSIVGTINIVGRSGRYALYFCRKRKVKEV